MHIVRGLSYHFSAYKYNHQSSSPAIVLALVVTQCHHLQLFFMLLLQTASFCSCHKSSSSFYNDKKYHQINSSKCQANSYLNFLSPKTHPLPTGLVNKTYKQGKRHTQNCKFSCFSILCCLFCLSPSDTKYVNCPNYTSTDCYDTFLVISKAAPNITAINKWSEL